MVLDATVNHVFLGSGGSSFSRLVPSIFSSLKLDDFSSFRQIYQMYYVDETRHSFMQIQAY